MKLANKALKICGNNFLLSLSKDKLQAHLQLLEAESFHGVTLEEIISEAADYGVVHGLVSHLAEDGNGNTTLASGTPPQHGKNAIVTPLTKPTIILEKTKTKIAQDIVDFKELDNIVNVPKGKLLLKKTPLTAGTPGRNVLGEAVPAKPGKDVVIKCGPGVSLSDDGMEVHSTVEGKFVLEKGRPAVHVEHVVDSDVDMSVGNITFCGSKLVIKGQLLPGFTAKCQGDISIAKGIGNAEVFAGNNLVVHGGIIGLDTRIRVGGNMTMDFGENIGCIEVRGGLTVNKIIIQGHFRIGKDLVAISGKGSIIGGNYITGGSMYVKDLGSDAEVITDVTVGMPPSLAAKREKIDAAQKKWTRQHDKVVKNINTLADLQEQTMHLPRSKAILLRNMNKARHRLINEKKKLVHAEVELENEIKKYMREAKSEAIYVFGKVYPGVNVTIGDVHRRIGTEDGPVVIKLNRETKEIYIRTMSPDEKATFMERAKKQKS